MTISENPTLKELLVFIMEKKGSPMSLEKLTKALQLAQKHGLIYVEQRKQIEIKSMIALALTELKNSGLVNCRRFNDRNFYSLVSKTPTAGRRDHYRICPDQKIYRILS